jgi:hypothetical protein
LQDVCDGAATAAAATAVEVGRGGDLATESALRFGDVKAAVAEYLARDPARTAVRTTVRLSGDQRTLELTCEQTEHIAFGTMFGYGDGVHHRVTASAAAFLS